LLVSAHHISAAHAFWSPDIHCLLLRKGEAVPAILSDAVVDVVASVDKLCADEQVVTDPEMVLGDIEALLDAKAQIDARIALRLRQAEAHEATTELYGRGTKRWLVEEVLLAGAAASRLVRLARQGREHPATMATLATGRINTVHAAAILTALHTLPIHLRDTVEPHLIDRATAFPPEEIAGFVDELLQRLGIDNAGDIARDKRLADRGVNVATTMHGTRSLSGTLTPEVGERFEAALHVAAQKTSVDDDRTPGQRRHDALGVIADAFLAQQAPSFTGAPRTVIVTIDLDVLEGRLRDAFITLPSGARTNADTARRLACDAELIPVMLGGNGEVLDVGQAGHEFTAAVRRAAWIRDDGCVFTGCRNRCVELHHIVFRRHRGSNSLDNAAWLCNYHHWLVHEGGWTLRRQPDGNYLWTSPHGKQLLRPLARRPGTA
jgi:hypothetical protein